jgi:hypothetical protein
VSDWFGFSDLIEESTRRRRWITRRLMALTISMDGQFDSVSKIWVRLKVKAKAGLNPSAHSGTISGGFIVGIRYCKEFLLGLVKNSFVVAMYLSLQD